MWKNFNSNLLEILDTQYQIYMWKIHGILKIKERSQMYQVLMGKRVLGLLVHPIFTPELKVSMKSHNFKLEFAELIFQFLSKYISKHTITIG